MPITRPSLATITQRIQADIESELFDGVPLLVASMLRVIARVFAGAIHLCYGAITATANDLFYESATGDDLSRHALRWGLSRKAAAFASGTIEITGTEDYVVPSGTEFADETTGLTFETTAEVTLLSTATEVAVIASEAGEDWNLAAGTALEPVEANSDITATEITAMSGGSDEETDVALRRRIKARIANPPAGGTEADFVQWAEEISGVEKAWCFKATPTPGYTTVVVKASGADPVPSNDLLSDVEDNILAKMPAVPRGLVVAAVDPVNISMDGFLPADLTDAEATEYQEQIEENVQAYFDESAEPAGTIYISQIWNCFTSTGVSDCRPTELFVDDVSQGEFDDLVLTGYQYPVFDQIYWS